MVMVLVPLLPWTTVTEAGDAPMVKFGEAAALTVSAKVVLAFRLPEVPLMVTVAVPVVAVLLAVNVSVLVEVLGSYRTPGHTARKPDAVRVTLPVNPPAGVTVIVVAPLLPWVMVRLLVNPRA